MIIEATIIAITALLVWWLSGKDNRNKELLRNLREFEQRDIMDKREKTWTTTKKKQ